MLTFEQKQQLMKLLPEYHLMADFSHAPQLKGQGVIEAKTAQEVIDAAQLGLNRREIFFAVPDKDSLSGLLDKCRIVANSMEELVLINEAARPFAEAGNLIMVGLRLVAEGFDGVPSITLNQLQGMVHDIKQLRHISVCGCVIAGDLTGLHGKALGSFIRSSYQTAKMMTVILPCSMPYICVSNCLEAIAWNETAHPETFDEFLTAANIVGMQNSTAFYADYYLQ